MKPLFVPANDIDYTDVDAICGYQLLLCKIFERAGGLDYPLVNNATIREVQSEGRIWLREVRLLISGILDGKVNDIGAIPELLSSYDFFYRVCNGGQCYDYLREVKLKTVNLWLRGNKSISETDVALLLLFEADRDIGTLEKRYTDYAFSVLGKWIEELSRNGKFINTRFREAYKRLTYLLSQDLFVYISSKNQPTVKAQWVTAYTLTDDHLDRLGTKDLACYISFANTASSLSQPAFDDHIAHYAHHLSKLASRPDLHPYYRQALEITLAQYQPA